MGVRIGKGTPRRRIGSAFILLAVGLVLFVLNQLPMIVHVQLGRQEWGLMIALFLLNLTFCFLGALGSGGPISALEEG